MTHDEIIQEHAKLEATVAYLDRRIEYLSQARPQTAAYVAAAKEQQRVIDEKLADFIQARPRPYVGRVDLRTGDGDLEVYIGTCYISGHVYSWASPFAKVYYDTPDRLSQIDAPEGPIRGQVVLKRVYDIADARLLKVSEQFRLDVPGGRADTALVELLGASRGGSMGEAIATIQPDQYAQIAASDAQVLLIQGVAGSGKSIVGLHRVAFLVSPFNGRATRPTASKVVFFGPSRNFLSYVGNLLPSLNVQDVAQRTIDGWLLGTLSHRVKVDQRDALFERLLRQQPRQAEATLRAARIKGSLAMAAALDRHVQERRKSFVTAALPIDVPSGQTTLDVAQVRSLIRALPDAPLNNQRQLLVERVVQALAPLDPTLHRDAQRRELREFRKLARPAIERQVQAFWPQLDFANEYRRLLSDASALDKAARGKWRADASALAASLPRAKTSFHAEDLAALSYLDRLLNERPSAGFDHVVVDEAQEVSPLEMLAIKRHTRGDGFTILGDLAQNLSPSGVEHWQELLEPLGAASIRGFRVRASFRATREITRLANTVLKSARPRAASAVAIERHGERPVFRRSANATDMLAAIAEDIGALQADGMGTIGVVCKSVAEARRVHAGLRRLGVASEQLPEGRGPIVVGPSYMMRGLEYDAVILAGAHERNYTGTPLHARLLYIAVTRAAHRLHIHWFGKLASAFGAPPVSRRKARPTRGLQRPARAGRASRSGG